MPLTEYTPNKEHIASAIKSEVVNFLSTCEDLTPEERNAIYGLMGRKFREQLDVSQFLESCTIHGYERWKNENLEHAKLWKDIAVANASHSNSPAVIATSTVKEFIKQFTNQ